MKAWQTTALTAALALGLFTATGCGGLNLGLGSNSVKEKVSDNTFDGAAVTALEIQADSGNLIINPSDSDKIGAALYTTKSATNAYKLESETKGNTLVLHLVFKNKDDLISTGSADLNVTIPKKQYDNLQVKSDAGNIELHSAQSKNVVLDTQGGNITSDDVRGDVLRLNASAGNIKLNNATCTTSVSVVNQSGNQEVTGLKSTKADFNTYSGNLKMKDITSPTIRANSGSGNVELYLAQMSRDAEMTGTSGNLNVYLPQDAAFDVSGSTGAGNAKIEFDLKGTKDDHSFKGTVGSGGNHLKVETTNGNVKVAKQ